MRSKKKILFEEKTKVSKSWVGTLIQKETYKDKFGTIKIGEIRSCIIDTKWGQLLIPTYTDINKYAGKTLRITVEAIEDKK